MSFERYEKQYYLGREAAIQGRGHHELPNEAQIDGWSDYLEGEQVCWDAACDRYPVPLVDPEPKIVSSLFDKPHSRVETPYDIRNCWNSRLVF